jgi:hypothetical protein
MDTDYATLKALMNAHIRILGPTVVYGREVAGHVRAVNPDNRTFTIVDDEVAEYPAGFGVPLFLADEDDGPRLTQQMATGQ